MLHPYNISTFLPALFYTFSSSLEVSLLECYNLMTKKRKKGINFFLTPYCTIKAIIIYLSSLTFQTVFKHNTVLQIQ